MKNSKLYTTLCAVVSILFLGFGPLSAQNTQEQNQALETSRGASQATLNSSVNTAGTELTLEASVSAVKTPVDICIVMDGGSGYLKTLKNGTDTKTLEEVMKNSAKNIIDHFKSSGASHRISLVKMGRYYPNNSLTTDEGDHIYSNVNCCEILRHFRDPKNTQGYNDLMTYVTYNNDYFKPKENSAIDKSYYALELANELFTNNPGQGVTAQGTPNDKKVTIAFFYDAEANSSSTYNSSATYAQDFLKSAQKLKSASGTDQTFYAIVYSGASCPTTPSDLHTKFAAATSSDKTRSNGLKYSSSSFTISTSNGNTSNTGYSYSFKTSNSVDEWNTAVNKIISKIEENAGQSVPTGFGTATEIRAVVNSNFTITDNPTIYRANTDGTEQEVISYCTVTINGNTVTVKGFDYTATANEGKKLMVKIPIQLKPYAHGTFNVTEGSVIHCEDDSEQAFPTQTHTKEASNNWVEKLDADPGTDNIVIDESKATIKTAQGLAWFISCVNGYNGKSATNLNAELANDVDMSMYGWVPIADNAERPYTGTFNGNGHVISGLQNTSYTSAAPGLFGYVSTGTVKNVAVKGCAFSASNASNYYGIIANEMTGGTVSGCVVSGSLTGSGKLGGVVGNVGGGMVHSCISMVNLTSGTLAHTIGSGATIEHCYATNSGNLWNTTPSGDINDCYKIDYSSTGGTYYTTKNNSSTFSITGFGYGKKGCEIGGTRMIESMTPGKWAQPVTANINSGCPVLKFDDFNTMAQDGDGFMHYGDLANFVSGSNTMLFYGKKDNMATPYTGDNLYIDEDAALKVSATVKAHTSRFIVGGQWHHYASPVAAQPLGISYHNPGSSGWDESNGPYLNPTGYNGLFPVDAASWDLYCFYEPDYHWINFKRNTGNHWHSENHTEKIDYTNETTLTPGKGYLVAMGESGYVQATGNLNHGNVTITVNVSNLSATPGAKLQGFNLIGNPYQSCLSFQAFANGNTSLWNGTTATYLTYEPESDCYIQGSVKKTSRGSAAASDDISMHQGFFIVSDIVPDPEVTYQATFTDAMCSVDSEAPFRGEKFAYPLINLVARDAEGLGDVAVVEFDRPEFAAAPKIFNYGGKGKVFFRYGDEDDALLFLDEETDQLPVRFAAFEDGNYTIEWSTANADFSYLHLIDNMTGNDIDMLARDSYSFAAKTTDYESRFMLVFSYTGIGEQNGNEPARAFAFVHDGNLVVNGQGHMQVIDLNGRTVIDRQLTGEQNTVGLPNVAPGVYVIRLADSKESKVQKIIIK